MNSSVSDFMSRKSSLLEIFEQSISKIIAYPQNDVREVAKIMRDIEVDCIPVASSPWNKKVIGVIQFNKIKVFLNDQDFLKSPAILEKALNLTAKTVATVAPIAQIMAFGVFLVSAKLIFFCD